ncbi:MAG: acetylglutamate kinase [Alphaproteobacteria bacterium]
MVHNPLSDPIVPRSTAPADSGLIDKARTLAEALPYMRRYAGKTFVVKYGGHAMGDSVASRDFARDVALLKQVGIHVIIVHGGGPQISQMLDRLRIQSSFVDGLRVTDTAAVEIVEMVLSGSINKQLVASINAAGGRAVGLSGKDGNLIRARQLRRTQRDPDSNIEKVLDLGFVGEPESIDVTVLKPFHGSDIIPVIAPIGIGVDGATYNINADTVAGAIASALKAARLMLLTDVVGVLDDKKHLIPELDPARTRQMIGAGIISGGMIPKVETCISAVAGGVEAAVILDGRVPHALLIEAFTPRGCGTIFRERT